MSRVTCFVALCVVFVGCGPTESVRNAARRRSALESTATNTLDERFVKMAKKYPGFAGLFVENEARQIIVLGTPGFELTEEIRNVLFEAFIYGRVLYLVGVETIEPQLSDLVLKEVPLSFDQVKQYQLEIADELLLNGLEFEHVDADEVRNSVSVTVPYGKAATTEWALDALGYHGVYNVLEAPKNERRRTLQDDVRPVIAGMQIEQAGEGACTLGFNVLLPNGDDGFVTASHCTRGADGTTGFTGIPSAASKRWTYQPYEVIGFNRIGSEIVDPMLSTNQAMCPPSSAGCRLTDSALFSYDGLPTGQQGRIAATVGRCTAPNLECPIDEGYNGFTSGRLVSNLVDRVDPLVGQVIEKTGRTTGHTAGAVTATCAISTGAFIGTTDVMLCNYTASLPSSYGDSGAGIYIGPGNVVWATGILWGGPVNDFATTFFNALGDVMTELGDFQVNH